MQQQSHIQYLILMSFCQKHKNHHCIHAHNCHNPQHKSHQRGQIHNKKVIHAQQEVELQQQCLFKRDKTILCTQCKSKNTNLEQIQAKLSNLSKSKAEISQKNDKLESENKHLQGQIEYYRQQFTLIITQHTSESQTQTKKRVVESIEANLKINSLQNQKIALEKQIKRLNFAIENLNSQKVSHCTHENNLEIKYNELYLKYKQLVKENKNKKQEVRNKKKNDEVNQNRFNMIKNQNNRQIEELKKTNNRLAHQIQTLTKQKLNLEGYVKRQIQMLTIDITNKQNKEQLLISKVKQLQIKLKDLLQNQSRLNDKIIQITDELFHAKRIIQKTTLATEQYGQLKTSLAQKQDQNRTVLKQKNVDSDNRQNNSVEKQLRQQIDQLKQKIVNLQKGGCVSNYEEIIYNMGASEAFKRLLDEKNEAIKKLMREKSYIYAKFEAGHAI